MWKSKRNIQENSKVACAVTSLEGLETYVFKGDFKEFQYKGELVEKANNKPLFKYNAYTGVRGVGIISVKKTYPPFKMINLSMITNALKIKIGKGKVNSYPENETEIKIKSFLHPRIINSFKGLLSLKAMAFIDEDDYPMILPLTSISPKKNGQRLVFAFSGMKKYIEKIPLLSKVAICIFKMKSDKNLLSLMMSDKIPLGVVQPVAYQLKGRFKGINKFRGVHLGIIDLEEVYSASPPLCGQLIVQI